VVLVCPTALKVISGKSAAHVRNEPAHIGVFVCAPSFVLCF